MVCLEFPMKPSLCVVASTEQQAESEDSNGSILVNY